MQSAPTYIREIFEGMNLMRVCDESIMVPSQEFCEYDVEHDHCLCLSDLELSLIQSLLIIVIKLNQSRIPMPICIHE